MLSERRSMKTRVATAVTHFAYGFGRLRELSSGVGLRHVAGVPCFIRGGGTPEFLVCHQRADDLAPRLEGAARVHDVSFFPAGDETLVPGWKARGYRQRYTEYLMQCPLTRVRRSRATWRVQRARTARQLDALSQAKGWGRRYVVPYLSDDDVHVLYVEDDGEIVAGGNLVRLHELHAAYIEDMFTVRRRQRLGIGSAVVRHMLETAGDANALCCTLVARAGAKGFCDAGGFEMLSALRPLMKR